MIQKNFFIIPGFKEQATDKNYAWLLAFLKTKNYKVVPVPVKWNYKTLSENKVELVDFFKKYKGEENHILGFSYGAVLAMLIGNEVKPKRLYLCSLSPHFSEDLKFLSPEIKEYIGKRRLLDIENRSGRELAKSLNVPTVVFYGEDEGKQFPQLKKRCEETVELISKSKLILVKNAPHKIDFSGYVEAVKEELKYYKF